MDGSSAREQRTFSEKFPRNSATVQTGTDLADFQSDLVIWLSRELPAFEIVAAVVDPAANRISIENLRSSSEPPGLSTTWLKSHLERHPSLVQKLSHGELVGISSSEASDTPRPAENVRASIVLAPVVHEKNLLAIFGIVSWMDGPQPSTEQLETIRTCTVQCAPSLARIVELGQVRKENEGLRRQVDDLSASIKSAAQDTVHNTQLRALAQIHTHLHSNVAHELRTPLAAVRGYARMMLDGRSGDVSDRQREYLTIVVENANKMIQLVNWMSDVFESSEQGMDLVEVDFREIWAEQFRSKEAALSSASITLTQDIPDSPFVGIADRGRLGRMFNQLLSVAVAFTDAGGEVTTTFSHGRERDINVKISGISRDIPPEVATRERGRQVRPDIDLASVYDSVGVHGGRFFLRRTPDEGTVLLVTFPAIRSEGSAQP